MKKVLGLLAMICIVASCTNEDLLVPTTTEVTEKLQIVGNMGIKVETPFVKNEVAMNVKAETAGTYVVKILNIANKSVSKEEVTIKAGNNLLKIYANALPSSAYRIGLFDLEGNLLGIADFNKL
jgi:nitrous oxide reductase accessory protein NosL